MTRARRSRFYVSGGLELESEPDWIVLTGTVLCAGGIRIQAAERLRIVRESPWFRRKGNPLLELQFYANNAVLSSSGPIFRYNSPHVDHNQFHHVHRYDVFGDVLGPGEQMMPPRQLHECEVPTLRQVIEEAEEWYYVNLSRLSLA
jgi:hypothetical protein